MGVSTTITVSDTVVLFFLFGHTDDLQIHRSDIDPGLPPPQLDPLTGRQLSKVHRVDYTEETFLSGLSHRY